MQIQGGQDSLIHHLSYAENSNALMGKMQCRIKRLSVNP